MSETTSIVRTVKPEWMFIMAVGGTPQFFYFLFGFELAVVASFGLLAALLVALNL